MKGNQMKSIYKILPYFIIEYLAMKYCEQAGSHETMKAVFAFPDIIITKKIK